MSGRALFDEPSEVGTEPGMVLVGGRVGVAVSMAREAAAEISQRLLHCAAQAAGKRRLKDGPGARQ